MLNACMYPSIITYAFYKYSLQKLNLVNALS